jgi:hypothetical protein
MILREAQILNHVSGTRILTHLKTISYDTLR